MNKIYNNLNIDNLMKTLYKDFNNFQKEEIKIGIIKCLDVSIYAKTEFDEFQMKEIRYGLEDNLNVSVYAKPELDSKEMAQSRGRMLLRKSTLL